MAKDTAVGRPNDVEEGPGSLSGALWGFLQSVRTTIYVLPLLAIATTIGAIIPQKRPVGFYDMAYRPALSRLITGLGLDSIYTSTWFIILIGLLLLNLAACVGRSFGRAARRYRGPAPQALARKLAGARAGGCWQARSSLPGLGDKVAQTFRRAHYAVAEHEGAKERSWLLVRRWPSAHFASLITHLAIFLVALGAVLGCLPWTSLDRELTIVEGQTHLDEDGKLGFDVRLDDFRMDRYEETNAPRDYRSEVVLLVNGREVKRGTATVNSQVKYRGVALGQANWGLVGVLVSVTDKEGRKETVPFALAEAATADGSTAWVLEDAQRGVALAGRRAGLMAVDFEADAVEDQGRIIGSASQYPWQPAVALQLVTGVDTGKHQFHDLGWVRMGEQKSVEGYTVRFDDLVYRSTLSARRDPGLPFVWAGFILVSLGMIVTFYVRPRAFLIEVADGSEGREAQVRVAPAGREVNEADRGIIEAACGARLSPRAPRRTRR